MTRLRLLCPSARALSREISGGGGTRSSSRIRNHVQSCDACRAEWLSQQRLAALARALPPLPSPPEELEGVRTSLLAGSRPARPRSKVRPIWLLGSAALLASVALAGLFHGRGPTVDPLARRASNTHSAAPPKRRGVVRGGPTAVFIVEHEQPDEVVRLVDGDITIEVEPLRAGERFRVMTGDAEVEVKGTVFSVAARHDRLTIVNVARGLVVCRAQGKDPVTLGANDRWEVATQNGSSAKPERTFGGGVVLRPPAHVAARVSAAPSRDLRRVSPPSSAETAFEEGWRALRAQRLVDAASAFTHAVAAANDQPLAEDAWFWMAVCQARIPRPAEARSSLVAFIDRFPRSTRVGEAAAMLGWIMVDQGDVDGAARWFATAAGDPAATVRESAHQGLRAVALRRGISNRR